MTLCHNRFSRKNTWKLKVYRKFVQFVFVFCSSLHHSGEGYPTIRIIDSFGTYCINKIKYRETFDSSVSPHSSDGEIKAIVNKA